MAVGDLFGGEEHRKRRVAAAEARLGQRGIDLAVGIQSLRDLLTVKSAARLVNQALIVADASRVVLDAVGDVSTFQHVMSGRLLTADPGPTRQGVGKALHLIIANAPQEALEFGELLVQGGAKIYGRFVGDLTFELLVEAALNVTSIALTAGAAAAILQRDSRKENVPGTENGWFNVIPGLPELRTETEKGFRNLVNELLWLMLDEQLFRL